MKPPKSSRRTSVSTDKLQAVKEPPATFEEGRAHLDAERVIKAWCDSADVMKDVAAAVRENQEDNEVTRKLLEETRENMNRNRNMLLLGGGIITGLQISTIVVKLVGF